MMADDRLETAERLLGAGSVGQAAGLLRALVAEQPRWARAQALLGQTLIAAGDRAGAEIAMRAALDVEPSSAFAATTLASLLTARRAPAEAVALLAPVAKRPGVDLHVLFAYGDALKAVGRRDEAAEVYRAAAETSESGAAWHNLAGVLGDAHRFVESESACRRAFSTGLDAPETWLVLARALLGQGRFDESEAAFREAIKRRPAYGEAHADLAQLIWMRTEDLTAAAADLEAALKASPDDTGLILAKARLLEYAVAPAAAYAAMAETFARRSADAQVQVAAALLALWADPEKALEHALRAASFGASAPPAMAALCQAYLAVGQRGSGS